MVDNLQWLAEHDPLTELPNRAHFQRAVIGQLARLEQRGSGGALFMIDLDRFKPVNDTMGHCVGDQVLQLLAGRLRLIAAHLADNQAGPDGGAGMALDEAFRPSLGRFGGDEFTLFVPGYIQERQAQRLAKRIGRVMSEPCELGRHTVSVGASIGIALSPHHRGIYDELMRAADTAMFHAKRGGGANFAFYNNQFEQEAREKARLEQDLRAALANRQFCLFYQPQFECRSGVLRGAEALIRWEHPQRGLLMPAQFISLAEHIGLIGEIGNQVLFDAIANLARWHRSGQGIRVSVNVSPVQLCSFDFIALVKGWLNQQGAPPELLELEITESAAMAEDPILVERLGRLRDLGISIAVDDFGTGYSNLARLMRLPVNRLKIDRSLVKDVATRSEARVLIEMIHSMATTLGMESVAEGVEDDQQLLALATIGCDLVQGYLMSYPLNEADFAILAKNTSPARAINAA